MSLEAVTAASRFGLGPRPGDLGAIGGDPRGWLRAQLRGPDMAPAGTSDPAAVADAVTIDGERDLAQRRARRRAARETYENDAADRTLGQIRTGQPFRERLVAFWSNHFTVSVQRIKLMGLAGPFEREAIRPHVLGSFSDLLRAASRHPAMLLYLDQARSFGPGSLIGLDRGKGLNENFARELMELHTLGAEGGYTQADVTQLAAILTGWSVGEDGFQFRGRGHEPGLKTFLGRGYEERGIKEGEAALATLAGHPSTARHVATKLACHFVADQPPPALVDRLAARFLKTGGDLRAVSLELVEAPEAWAQPLAKVRAPNELVVAAARALGEEPPPELLLSSLRQLGQLPFAAPSPRGWPDTGDAWTGSESLMLRVGWAALLARRLGQGRSGTDVLETALGPAASPATRTVVADAGATPEAVAFVLGSPEFQRR